VDETTQNNRQLHFLPFNKGNRDEEFSQEDSNKIGPAFTQTEPSMDPDKEFSVLRTYLAQLRHSKPQTSQEEKKHAGKGGPSKSNPDSEAGQASSQQREN